MEKLSIKDSLFSHAFSSSNWYKPANFEWDFNKLEIFNNFIFLTDHNLYEVDNYNNIKKYAWLVESPSVTPKAYEFVKNNGNKFDKIFTFNKEILDRYDNAYLLPIGGCHLDGDEISLNHLKTKIISMMVSNKRFAEGHNVRHDIVSKYRNLFDLYGNGYGPFAKKILSTKDYMFSIVVENHKEDYYFTEKIVDVFLCGTIPIYWGCPSIGKFFNVNGFITFNTTNELYDIIKDKDYLSDFYNKNKEIIKENFHKALEYKICEDFLYKTYRNIL